MNCKEIKIKRARSLVYMARELVKNGILYFILQITNPRMVACLLAIF